MVLAVHDHRDESVKVTCDSYVRLQWNVLRHFMLRSLPYHAQALDRLSFFLCAQLIPLLGSLLLFYLGFLYLGFLYLVLLPLRY